ncbi:nickel-dependent hydrogenase large subunit [Neptunomonas sp. XY-337]|uniref:nickel-dependent hydrogenase large subunit n=1 Tax=Neptunomonas sp. XY-337 TaxID=2561897 RepID=UPI0010AA6B02|nr:nickel-dependent hydrogenase large subunit [Neptunomonas sp. XY-337]
MSKVLVGPFNRVEGDLEITLETADNRVSEARVNSPLYRGFETMLVGKAPYDAMVYTPRICGICSVSQSVGAARALADISKLEIPENGQLCTNLVLANENMADLLTHFYLFFMPDFARESYRGQPWFTSAEARFKAVKGTAHQEVLPARAKFLNLMGILAGKWPHSLSIQPGGTAKPIEPQERIRLLTLLGEFRSFLEQTLFGDDLERIAEISSTEQLQQWSEEADWQSSDLRRFLHISQSLALDTLGRATDQFMSYGNYPLDGTAFFKRGTYFGDQAGDLAVSSITEDVSHGWMESDTPRHPIRGRTVPTLQNEEAYSWCKAPRLGNQVVEVGAIARQAINGNPLVMDLIAKQGANVHSRIVARLLELALVIPQMQRWAKAIDPSEPFCNTAKLPKEGEGAGLLEAARGSLGHWVTLENGMIKNYQIIAPTTWNFSPRDANQQPGALEQALENTPLDSEETAQSVAVQHVVRSFDPCMVCTVH